LRPHKNERGECRARPGIPRAQRTLGDSGLWAGAIGRAGITGAGESSGTEAGPGFARDAIFVEAGACRFDAFTTLL